MNATINTGKTVHSTETYGVGAAETTVTRCGAELAKGGTLRKTTAGVTCKRCISFEGIAHNGSVTPRKATPVAPKPVKTETVKCGATLVKLPYGKHIREHNMKCHTCLGL